MSESEIKEILKVASSYMRNQNHERAISAIEAGLDKFPQKKKLYHALSVTHQKAKNFGPALEAIQALINIDRADISAWVIKGALHERALDYREALQAYHCAISLGEPRLTSLPPNLRTELNQVKRRTSHILKNIEKNIGQKLKAVDFDATDEDQRFATALDISFGHKRRYIQEPRQLYYPGLATIEFFDKSKFSWIEKLEKQWEAIRAEALSLLQQKALFAPYLQSDDHIPGSEKMHLANNMDWSSLYLIKDGVDIIENQKRCPATTEALKDVDLCRTKGNTPSVLFSLLQPGAHIPPHTGMINTRLICHLPLIVPGNCELRVGNSHHEWREGEIVIFDDTIEHEAWNRSNEDRLVLLFDVWRPEINDREKELLNIILSER